MYREFDRIVRSRGAGGRVLEVGASASADSLLTLPALAGVTEKIGINLDGSATYADFTIVHGDANDMDCFPDARFDTVLCNSVLEHDRHFWKTLAELRRISTVMMPPRLIGAGVKP